MRADLATRGDERSAFQAPPSRPIAVVAGSDEARDAAADRLRAAGFAPYAPRQWPDARAHLLWIEADGPEQALLTRAAPHCPIVVRLPSEAPIDQLTGIAWEGVGAVVAGGDVAQDQAPGGLARWLGAAKTVADRTGGPLSPQVVSTLRQLLESAQPPPRLSVSILTRADEPLLLDCLRSVIDVADEIVVQVDARTEGDAAEVAAEFTDRSRIHVEVPPLFGCDPPRIDFAAARNRGLDLIDGDWCFVIDADERLADATLLREAVAHAAWIGLDAVAARVDCHTDRGLVESAMATRLFRRDPSIRWRHPVHNQLVGVGAVLASQAVIRSSYEGPDALRGRVARALPALHAMYDAPGASRDQRAHAAFYLCRSHAAVGDHEEVIRWARQCRDLCGDHPSVAPYWVWWADATLQAEGPDAAQAVIDEGLSRHPGLADLWHLRLGLDLARWHEAASSPGLYAASAQRSLRFGDGAQQAADAVGLPLTFAAGPGAASTAAIPAGTCEGTP